MSDQKFTRTCNVDGCDRKHYGNGYCAAHNARYYRHGDVQASQPLKTSPGEALGWLMTLITDPQTNQCVTWPFNRHPFGYGTISWDGKTQCVHRVALLLTAGAPPTPKHQCAHSCGNGAAGCVNPLHLRWATAQDNQLDRLNHGTDCRGEKNPASKLTEQQVVSIYHDRRSQRAIASVFGVSQPSVGKIKRNESWAWLDKPLY